MKIRIKEFNMELPDYLTIDKEYEVLEECGGIYSLIDDEGDLICVYLLNSSHLNGGSWEIVKDE